MTRQQKGVLGTKLGMTQVFGGDGKIVPVTVVAAGPCVVTAVKKADTDGYSAVQLAFGDIDPRRVNKPKAGVFAKAGVTPRRYLVELRTSDAEEYTIGDEITTEKFEPGEIVDVTAKSKGKGFAGVMKRHNFHGGPKTHGQSDRWRHSGSVGSGTTPGRTFKNMRMAGHLGDARVTVKNLRILSVDPERNLVALRGAIPGPKGGLVMIRKKPLETY